VAQAAGRAEHQPVRVTSVLKKGPRATSTEPAETSRRSETCGASCRTSQEPAVPRDKRAQKQTSHQERRPRGKRARREPNIGWRPVRAARRSSRMAESGRPPYAEVAFSGIKGGGAFWILQSRRSEHPHGGELYDTAPCKDTLRDEQRAPRFANLRRPERIRAGEARRIRH
jgi:hypothetical protein